MKIFSGLIAFFCVLQVFGQSNSYVKKGELQIGEQTDLVYEFTFEGTKDDIKFEAFSKIIPCNKRIGNSSINTGESAELEIVSPFYDSVFSQNGFTKWRGIYRITVWDTGNIIIPPTSLIFKDSIIDFMPVFLSVSMPKLVEGKEIYGIKETFVEVESEYASWFKSYWWIILIAFLLVTLLVILWFKKRKAKLIPKKILNLKKRTLIALESLEKSKLWEKSQLKEHYIELSYIFRSYLSSRYSLNFLEKTSHETALLLAQLEIDTDTVDTIKVILDYSDMVKFAKAIPNESEILRNIAQVKQIIVETSPLEIDHVE